jgi:hypothetical protein
MRRLDLDTSLLVAALVHKAGTATAVGFLQAHAKQPSKPKQTAQPPAANEAPHAASPARAAAPSRRYRFVSQRSPLQ